jgi:hypothetical protein
MEGEMPAATEAATPEPMGPPTTPEAKIASAMSAAPPEIAANAMIMDWPAAEGGEMTELRAGGNGWTCMPDVPSTDGLDPMCLDAQFLGWAGAWQTKTQPTVTAVGLAYMLMGDAGASNTDPFATGPTPDNGWIRTGPHVMMIVPDVAQLDGIPTDPATGGPYVMWKGTPYAHVMMPVASAKR